MTGEPKASEAPPETHYPSLNAASQSRLTELLLEAIRSRYGKPLSADHVEQIRAGIAAQIATSERLHQYPLVNADEPAFLFGAHDEEG